MSEFYTPQKPSPNVNAFSEARYTTYASGVADLFRQTGQYDGRAQRALFALARSQFPKERWAALYLFLNSGRQGIINEDTSRLAIAKALVAKNWLLPSWSVLESLPDAVHFLKTLKEHASSESPAKGPTPVFSPRKGEAAGEAKEVNEDEVDENVVCARVWICM